jgi:hypothetical protein
MLEPGYFEQIARSFPEPFENELLPEQTCGLEDFKQRRYACAIDVNDVFSVHG